MSTGRDPEGTFDTPQFGDPAFAKGAKNSGAQGSKEDGFFVN
jgi:xylulose-5-phosphate/fructose-6-phosphate phosphoketolase